ncbi:MAG: UbiA prenyltransferase family protein [Thermoplasmatales archaeon]|nr:UbiA prenyltransferase family protein [Thermoplasmatales archaeon]
MKQYLILFRPYGILFLGLIPVFGALANGEFNPSNLILLFIIGLLVHIFAFVQNDYYDVEVDRKSKYVANRPLAAGSISQQTVVIIFVSSFVLSLTLTIVFFFTIYSFLALISSFFCMSLYNKYSKRFAGMEFILSIGVFFYGLFGALTVSTTIPPLALLVALFGSLQWLFSVGITANLKDVEFDVKQGINTTPVLLGTHIDGKSLVIPLLFKVYAFTIKILHILAALLILVLGYASFTVYNIPIPGIIFLIVSIVLMYLTHKILSTDLTKRDTMLILIGLQEGLAFLLLPISLMSYLIVHITLLSTTILLVMMVIWPLFWFRILYGKHMIPLE